MSWNCSSGSCRSCASRSGNCQSGNYWSGHCKSRNWEVGTGSGDWVWVLGVGTRGVRTASLELRVGTGNCGGN